MKALVARASLDHAIRVESAGTAGYHEGDPADARSRRFAKRRGYVLDGTARQFRAVDFRRFDHVVAMDGQNAARLRALAREGSEQDKVRLLRDFDSASAPGSDVPDPYYGGDAGFDEVIDLCERACAGLLAHLRDVGRI